jgi:glucoamylase
MWLDGSPYWHGVQMDETALPILLVDLASRAGALQSSESTRYWSMVRQAAQYLAVNGPVTQQDRWEEDPGYNPFTLSAQIAALLAAAEMADAAGEPTAARYLRETADCWNGRIEHWTYAANTDLSRKYGVAGYYVRIAPPEASDAASPLDGFVAIKNRPPDHSSAPATQIVGTDFLALVRFGLRAADDPKIIDTLRVVDGELKTEFSYGPGWHRYTGDGYGENADGTPFDGTGVGRVWPLFTGERAHYELAGGRTTEAERLRGTLEAMANRGGLIPEQTWDTDDIPERGQFFGLPAGSAMPLVWAHGEYIKLLRSLRDGAVFDMPPQTRLRYVEQRRQSPHSSWRFNHKCRRLAAGKLLRIEVLQPAVVHWGRDGWHEVQDASTSDTTLGMYVVDLPTGELPCGSTVEFTFYWPAASRWEGVDYSVRVEP